MEKDRCIAALLADSAALADAARLGLDARVPSCPDWNVAELVEHTGRVHRTMTRRVRDRETARNPAATVPLPERSDLIPWFETGVQTLADVLVAAPPDAEVWNWSVTPKLASFWWRRMAQETAVHRWDGQSAHGQQQPVDPDVAVDGIDEFLDVFLPTDLAERPDTELGGTVALRCTDRAASWLVTVTGGKLVARRGEEPTTADVPLATVAGTASDLLLLLWRRIEPAAPGIETGGDAALLARFVALADLG